MRKHRPSYFARAASLGLVLMLASASVSFAQAQRHDHHWDKSKPQFDDYEREVVRNWFQAHAANLPPGFRDEDRLPAGWVSKLQSGFVLNADWQKREHPLAPDLAAQLPAPPDDDRYVALGRHVVLLDSDSHVLDTIAVDLN